MDSITKVVTELDGWRWWDILDKYQRFLQTILRSDIK